MKPVLIIGSGPAGASAALDLTKNGVPVTLLEWGKAAPLRGHFIDMAKIAALPGRSAFMASDGSLLFRGIGVGGTTLVNYATAFPPPLERFAALGIDLAPALANVQRELALAPLPDALRGPQAKRLENAALQLGLPWQRFDKMIDPAHCRTSCWRCSYGCPYGAKWSARKLIEQACAAGANLLEGAHARQILHKKQRVCGVEYVKDGQLQQVQANTVILAAGGIGSPRLLATAGITPTTGLFVDPVVAVMGRVEKNLGAGEVPMVGGMHRADGLMLADMALPRLLFQAFNAQAGNFGQLRAHQHSLSLMVKVPDALGGQLSRHWVNKPLSRADRQGLDEGQSIASNILRAAGATKIFASRPFAAHPGGSATISDIVDENLQTRLPGLFVCDASVLPAPWGYPPTLTLICLAKRLAGQLISGQVQ